MSSGDRAYASAPLGTRSKQDVREIHTHPLHFALARDRLDHLPCDREAQSFSCVAVASVRIAGIGRMLGVGIGIWNGVGRGRRREAAHEETALIERESGILDAEVARARDVCERAAHDDVRRCAPVRVCPSLDGPERGPHRVYL